MEDQQAWHKALMEIGQWYECLSDECRSRINTLVSQTMKLKERLLEIAFAAGSAAICRTCGGQCCLYGKYHVTELDLLAYSVDKAAPVVPDFTHAPSCPYGNAQGCQMAPRYRPLTCVIFNCELVEERMETKASQQAAELERELRRAIDQAEQASGRSLRRPALLSIMK